jgi:hypothetical protein
MNERRRHRSRYKGIALNLWLDAVARRHSVPVVAVGTEAGFLIAGSVPSEKAEELTAVAASLARPGPRPVVLDARGTTVVVKSLPLEAETLFLCATGHPGLGLRALDEAGPGVERILSE